MYTMVKILRRSGLRLLNHGNFDPGARGECRRCELAGLGDGASKGLALPGGFSPPRYFFVAKKGQVKVTVEKHNTYLCNHLGLCHVD